MISVGWDYLKDGTLEKALWASLQRVLWGLGIGIVLGVALALVSGLTRSGDDLIDSNVQMLRFVPIIGLQPLLILWLGLGETAKISLIVMGVAGVMLFQIAINIGMCVGLMPVTGIPLPLMSYGGSSVIYTFLALGIVMNIRMRRFVN